MSENYRIEGTTLIFNDNVTSITKKDLHYKSDCLKNELNIITSIIIPDSMTFIGQSAFKGCKALESINIPDSVIFISMYAFQNCESLKSITIPDSVTKIKWGAFSGCKSLKSIAIPDGVTKIGNFAFWGCESLKSITISNSVTSIEDCAFDGCNNLTIKYNKGSYAEQYAKEHNIPCKTTKSDKSKNDYGYDT